jgi:hypothetical protein
LYSYTTSSASFYTTYSISKVYSSNYLSFSSKSTTCTTSPASFSTMYSISKVYSSNYPFSSESTNYTASSTSFSTACSFYKVSSSNYPSMSSKSSKGSEEDDADVNKPSTVLSSAMGKCFGNLQNYQHN